MQRRLTAKQRQSAIQFWQDCLPYGKWTCEDGREVLFNRQYWPLLERRPDKPILVTKSSEWITGIVATDFFFDDSDNPVRLSARNLDRSVAYRCMDALASCNKVLAEWGYPPLPPPATLLPLTNVRVFSLDKLPEHPRRNPYADGKFWFF